MFYIMARIRLYVLMFLRYNAIAIGALYQNIQLSVGLILISMIVKKSPHYIFREVNRLSYRD